MSQFERNKVGFNNPVTREPHDHELFLSFNDDEDSVDFQEWLQVCGWTAFEQWRREGKPM